MSLIEELGVSLKDFVPGYSRAYYGPSPKRSAGRYQQEPF